MIDEAEKFKEDDENNKAKIDARNELEQYVYNVRNSMEEPIIKEKLQDEYNTVMDAVKETVQWFNNNMEASKDEYVSRKNEFESIVAPIIKKIYNAGENARQTQSQNDMPEQQSSNAQNPKVEEVD
jgi:L1 cell adhesion molecule like protein